MDLDHMVLSERSQTQEAAQRVIPFVWNAQDRQIQRQEADPWLPGGGEEGDGE